VQSELFTIEVREKKQHYSTKKLANKPNGAKDAISRYVGLKNALDQDFYNANWIEVDTTKSIHTKHRLFFVDLFSGAGGISAGFRKAGFTKLMSVELDNDASNTIRKNFPESVHFEKPVEELTFDEIDSVLGGKTVHVVCGGPPCQGFSVAGLRNPHDPRNQLFKEYVRVVSHIKPLYIMIENVPGILTMQGGKVYHEILRQLEDIGYTGTTVRILEAAEFGVPQLRTRAVFIGNCLGQKNPYPKSLLNRSQYKPIESAIDDLKHHPEDPNFNHNGTRHSKAMEKRLAKVPPGGSLYESFRDAWKRQYLGVPAMTIKENHGGVHVHYELNRVLTAREMARLQTFPDDFFFTGTFKRAYWQIGNAVPPLLAEHLALAIKSGVVNTSY
jgi:DNA (cytosine-5)-methyltransferase 1